MSSTAASPRSSMAAPAASDLNRRCSISPATRPALLRPGGVSIEDLEAAIGPIDVADDDNAAPRGPGMLASHYAPALPAAAGCDER